MIKNCGTELVGLGATLLMEDAHVPAAVQRQIRLRSYDATALLRNNVWRWDCRTQTVDAVAMNTRMGWRCGFGPDKARCIGEQSAASSAQ